MSSNNDQHKKRRNSERRNQFSSSSSSSSSSSDSDDSSKRRHQHSRRLNEKKAERDRDRDHDRSRSPPIYGTPISHRPIPNNALQATPTKKKPTRRAARDDEQAFQRSDSIEMLNVAAGASEPRPPSRRDNADRFADGGFSSPRNPRPYGGAIELPQTPPRQDERAANFSSPQSPRLNAGPLEPPRTPTRPLSPFQSPQPDRARVQNRLLYEEPAPDHDLRNVTMTPPDSLPSPPARNYYDDEDDDRQVRSPIRQPENNLNDDIIASPPRSPAKQAASLVGEASGVVAGGASPSSKNRREVSTTFYPSNQHPEGSSHYRLPSNYFQQQQRSPNNRRQIATTFHSSGQQRQQQAAPASPKSPRRLAFKSARNKSAMEPRPGRIGPGREKATSSDAVGAAASNAMDATMASPFRRYRTVASAESSPLIDGGNNMEVAVASSSSHQDAVDEATMTVNNNVAGEPMEVVVPNSPRRNEVAELANLNIRHHDDDDYMADANIFQVNNDVVARFLRNLHDNAHKKMEDD